MTYLRWFTWYYRYTKRWSLYVLRQSKNPGLGQLVLCVFYIVIPGVIGALVFVALYVTGLTKLFSEGYVPSFISTDNVSVFSHGATTFASAAVGLALLYWLLGMLLSLPDAFRPPKFKTKEHLWKD